MNAGLKRALIYVAGGLVALIAIVAVLPFLIPVDSYRNQIEQAANRATGRTLRIGGSLRLTLFPQIGLSAGDVKFSNKPGALAVDMASVGDAQLSVALLPLLSGNIEVARIILDKPTINLEVDKQGQGNWTFATENTQSQSSSRASLPQTIRFSGIEIRQGRISYANTLTGKTLLLDNLDATIDVTEQSRPVAIKGSFVRNGKAIEFNGALATPKTLSEGAATQLELALSGELGKASFKGEIAADRAVSGALTLNTPSLRQLGQWLEMDMPSGGGLKAMSLSANVNSKNGISSLSAMRLSIDGMTISGDLSADTNPTLTAVQGRLSVDHLDLNPYMQASTQKAAKAGAWSDDPIAFDAFKKFNADLSLSTGSLTVRNFHIGRSSVAVRLQNGLLRADLNPVTLYGGVGHAVVNVDTNPATPQFRNVAEFDNVAVVDLLSDAIGVNKIEGAGTLVLDVSSSGKNANAVMRALSGKGSITVSNGKIRGINLGMIARTIQTVLSGNATGGGATTDFTQINGSFVIANGVMSNTDFKLAGPGLNATGQGSIDLGNQTMDFKIMPKANIGIANIGVPFRISGPWTGLHYRPDLEGLAKGVVQDLIRSPSSAKDLLGNILGGKKSGDTSAKGSDLLNNLFGR